MGQSRSRSEHVLLHGGVLRPGVEKSTPFSGGRYQDDQPYHHLPFPLPCVPPPSPLLSRLFSVAPLYGRLARSPSGVKFRSFAAFCRGGATLAVKRTTLSPSSPYVPPSSSRAPAYIRVANFFFPSPSDGLPLRIYSFSILLFSHYPYAFRAVST